MDHSRDPAKMRFSFIGGASLVVLGLMAVYHDSTSETPFTSANLKADDGSTSNGSIPIPIVTGFNIFQTKHALVYTADICINSAEAGSDAFVALAWRPSNSSLGWVQSQFYQIVDTGQETSCLDIDMTRIRGSSPYVVNLLMKHGSNGDVSSISSTSFLTNSSGYGFFDRKFAKVNGTSFPSWQVITTSGEYVRDKVGFRGIFSLDAEGWVVWFYDSGTYTYVFDWLKNGHIVLLHAHSSNYKWPGSFIEIDIKGSIIQNYTREECYNLRGFGLFDHEMRVHTFNTADDGIAGERVISTLRTAENFIDTDSYNASMYDGVGYFGGEKIVLWQPVSNEVTYMYNLFDYLNPYRDISTGGTGYSAYEHMTAHCTKKTYKPIMDYMHMNSVSVSEYEASFIVSLHSLDTIMSLYTNGTGLLWILSSSLKEKSTFLLKNSKAQFAGQHDVRQLPNGHLLMMDNSYDTNECDKCSRALMIRLDFDKRIAECEWEHVIHHQSLLGGSIRIPRSKDPGSKTKGPYVIAYTKLASADDAAYDHEDHYPTRVYEVYGNGSEASLMEIPAPNENWNSGNYRALPSKGVYREYDVSDTWDDMADYDYFF